MYVVIGLLVIAVPFLVNYILFYNVENLPAVRDLLGTTETTVGEYVLSSLPLVSLLFWALIIRTWFDYFETNIEESKIVTKTQEFFESDFSPNKKRKR